eukprot:362707-Prymnesium_polylepis.1
MVMKLLAASSAVAGEFSSASSSREPAIAVATAAEAMVAVGDSCVPPLDERAVSAAAAEAAACLSIR